jgi:hypothetical protein
MDELRLAMFVASSAVVAVTARARSQEVVRRQSYDETWQWSENEVFLYTTYRCRSEPEGPENSHRVVWYPKSEKHKGYVYYFDHSTGLIWCRAAAADRAMPDIWQVLSEDERNARIGSISDGIWDNHARTEATIPGCSDGALIDPPPLPPDPFH